MTNTLVKNTAVTYTPGSPGRPAIPATPGTPGYWAAVPTIQCGFLGVVPAAGQTYAATSSPPYVCQSVSVLTYFPPTAAAPAQLAVSPVLSQTLLDYNLGWNAGGRSLAQYLGDLYAQFTPLQAIGIVAGLSGQLDPSRGYASIPFGFYFSGGVARVMESGTVVATLGTYTRGDVFRLQRVGGVVSYLKNGALVYTSAVASAGMLFLTTSMYSGGDTLDAPSIGQLATSAGSLAPLGGYATQGQVCSAVTVLAALQGSSNFAQGSAGVLAALTGLSGVGIYGQAVGALVALTGTASGGFFAPSYTLSSGILAPLIGTSSCITGGTMQLNSAPLAPLTGLAGALGAAAGYAQSIGTLAPLQLSSYSFEGNNQASMGSGMTLGDGWNAGAEIAVVISDGGVIADIFSFNVLLDVAVAEGATIADPYTPSADLAAIMRSLVFTDSGMPVLSAPGALNQDNKVWVVDWEGDAHASTAYESYPFNSFACIDGVYYGAQDSGVYRLDGADDAGTPIHASVHFGRLDFKTSNRKHVPNVYAGVGASGQLYLRVSVDGGQPYLYTARRIDAAQRVTRFDLGKGLVGSYFAFELYNQNGADFDLDTVEFVAVPVTRRV